MIKYIIIGLFSLISLASVAQEPPIAINPRHYVCYRASSPVIIDGLQTDPDWQHAEWSDKFVDIEGSLKPDPAYWTRMKMLWDDKYLYVLAQLQEPNVWATLTERESVIFNDPDFEVFIDPDGDTHEYAEYEMNALNTQWDLLLLKPYRDDIIHNVAIDNWNYNGMKSAVYVNGSLNNPNDHDQGWTVEIAFPLDALIELSSTGKTPVSGEQYRINFSRVEWTVDVVDGKYKKRTVMAGGREKPLPENNWVWSPQGVVAMHQPETWGFLQFSMLTVGTGSEDYKECPDNPVKWALRMLYYRENAYFGKKNKYTTDLASLKLDKYEINGKDFRPVIILTPSGYEVSYGSLDNAGTWHIRQDGKLWKTEKK